MFSIDNIVAKRAAQSKIDSLNSRSRIKTAVKNWVTVHVTTELVADVVKNVNSDLLDCKIKMRVLEDALISDGFPEAVRDFAFCIKYKEPVRLNGAEKAVASQTDLDEYHRVWASYNALQGLIDLQYRIDSLSILLDGKHTKTIKSVFKAILNTQIKSKKNEVIMNALVNPICRAMKLDLKHSSFTVTMNVLESLKNMGLINMHTITGVKGGIEWMVSINLTNVAPVTRVYRSVRARYSKLVPTEVKAGDSLVSKHKFAYDAKISEGVADVINILNGVALKLDLGQKTVKDLVISKIEKDGALDFSQDWMKGALSSAELEYDIIKENGDQFYIDHFTDGVNRIYEGSEYFGAQQGSVIRESLRLADGQVLTDDGRSEMELAIACKAGMDKGTEEAAREFYEENESVLRKDSEYDTMFDMLDGRIDNLMVEQDENNSGPQFFAVGTGNMRLARITGLLNGERFDAYNLYADIMNQELKTQAFNRANVKSVFMTSLYNAGKKRILWGRTNSVVEGEEVDIEMSGPQLVGKLVPLMVNSPKSSEETWAAHRKAMWTIAPRAMEVMALIMRLAQSSTVLVPEFVMPDGAVCQMAHTVKEDYSIHWCDNAGRRHRMQHSATVLRANVKDTGYAPRIIQAMDAYALRELVRRANEEGIELVVIHDAFLSHPNHAKRVRELYREVLADMLDQDILSNIIHQLFGTYYKLQNKSTLTGDMILNSQYGLWY